MQTTAQCSQCSQTGAKCVYERQQRLGLHASHNLILTNRFMLLSKMNAAGRIRTWDLGVVGQPENKVHRLPHLAMLNINSQALTPAAKTAAKTRSSQLFTYIRTEPWHITCHSLLQISYPIPNL
ncbi:hypothetical protein VNO77_20225 [Canavalia gladiata]|uniref:Uncharacterized protein n=1 Tax=Canavalia gladiata TaxID=3824 RepID=A0AAN9LPR4_CANGL